MRLRRWRQVPPVYAPWRGWKAPVGEGTKLRQGDSPEVLIARGKFKRAAEHYARVLAEHADDHTGD